MAKYSALAEPSWQQNGATLWFTGLSGSGKTTISELVAQELKSSGLKVELLDGDVVRKHLCRDLGFSREHRRENVQRLGFLCQLLSRNGVIAIVAAISPYREDRDEVRAVSTNFVEVYMHCPLKVLIERDVKGLYAKAIAGELEHFTGISDPYEPPTSPEVTIDSSLETVESAVSKLMRHLRSSGLVEFREHAIAAP